MKNHSMNIRVYYEDTDLGGVVYYANYLRFIERARSEWIREIGIDQIKMRDDEKIIFVVTKLKADYLVPASFDDVLTIASKIKVVSPVRAYFYQNIYRGEELLFKAEVCVACTSTSGRVKRLPEKIKILKT
ncbi:MAG: tol-pal system-associated acyl-CoA thioesterase [Rhodobacterales bacterium]|nr:tol-pal system-associated acyl-CoA thioesterase [Rhodobacterales bacterium]